MATASPEGARAFANVLQSIGDGEFHAELSEELHALTNKLKAHAYDFGKAKGTLTVTFAIEIDRDEVVKIAPDVKTKVPKPARKPGRYWLTPGGNLSPENPKQTKLPLREVPAPRTRAVDVTDDAPVRGV